MRHPEHLPASPVSPPAPLPPIGQLAQPAYRRLFRSIERCNSYQRLAVCCFLSELVNGNRICALIDQVFRQKGRCPHCNSASLYGHGAANGLKRYRCRDCRRSFNGLTGTPLARLRLKDKWLAYVDCLRDPACTVHSAAASVKVHANTSFRWRHRFLAWTRFDRPQALRGIAEAGQVLLQQSHKGVKQRERKPRRHGGGRRKRQSGDANQLVRIVLARDRAGNTIDFVAGRGALKVAALQAQLLPKLARDAILVSDGNPVYPAFAQQARIRHEAAGGRGADTVDGAIHLQNVDAYRRRFQLWLWHFHGVATRYLENYLGWRWAIDGQRLGTSERFLRAALGYFTS